MHRPDIVVISDVHLGTFGCRAAELNDYLDRIDPGLLIINGDFIDGWSFSKNYFPSSHIQVIRKVLAKMRDGTKVIYLTGNHDEFLRRFTDFKMDNLQIQDKLVLLYGGKSHWFFHGDVFDVTMTHSKWLAKLGGKGYDALIMINHVVNWVLNKLGRERISLSKKVKNSVKHAIRFIQDFERTACELAIAQKYDYVVCGHIHQPAMRLYTNETGQVHYLNSGDWIENLSALEFIDGAWNLVYMQESAKRFFQQESGFDTPQVLGNRQRSGSALLEFRVHLWAMKFLSSMSLVLVLILGTGCPASRHVIQTNVTSEDLCSEVDPFVGTGGHGHTYPGATVPFGLVQLSPDTRLEGWDGCGGYHWDDSLIYGFSHTHLQGTGVSDYGDILFMPTNGKIRQAVQWKDAYKSKFSHSKEHAEPGYYSVVLDDYKIKAELTATEHVGIHQYQLQPGDSCRFFIDMMHRDDLYYYDIQTIGDTVVYGYRVSRGWAAEQHCYFYAVFSEPFHDFTQLDISYDDTSSHDIRKEVLEQVQVFSLQFPAGVETIQVRVGISGTDVDGAQRNLYAEAPAAPFDHYRQLARDQWNKQLSKVTLNTGTADERKLFYTSLYHCSTTPNVWSDVDGRYRGMDNKLHRAEGYVHYTVFSLWDTFRALHPLFTRIERDRTLDFIKTFLAMYQESGHLPVWELAGNETYCMIGYHSVSVIADAYASGITDFDTRLALEAMIKSATGPEQEKVDYEKYGYVPGDRYSESVSKTLEFAYDDWCIAQFAKRIGNDEVYTHFIERAQNWKNVYDPVTGFMRSRRNGGFAEPFDPYEVNFNYTEANAFQYQFFVPQDLNTLVDFMGGPEKFRLRLDSLFEAPSVIHGREQSDITGMIGQYVQGNEPSHNMAYLYQFINERKRCGEIVSQVMKNLYRTEPDGLCGNEDCGQMSAWYVMNRMGIYSMAPGNDLPLLHNDLFSFSQMESLPPEAGNVRASKIFAEESHAITTPSEVPEIRITDHLITPVPVIRGPVTSFSGSAEITLYNAHASAETHVTIQEEGKSPLKFVYTKPFTIRASCTVEAIAVAPGCEKSKQSEARFELRTDVRKMRSISTYDPQYTAGGEDALIDGIRGTEDFRVGHWQGFWKTDLEAVTDLGSNDTISHLGLSCYQEIRPWIWFPSEILFYVSKDGIHFRPVGSVKNDIPTNDERILIKEFGVDFPPEVVRYVKVVARPAFDRIPDWHPGKGGQPWIFADEFIIR